MMRVHFGGRAWVEQVMEMEFKGLVFICKSVAGGHCQMTLLPPVQAGL